MQSRFAGDDGMRRLVEALQHQDLVVGNGEIAEEIANSCEVTHVATGDAFITQGSADSDIYFLLSGRAAIEINGVEIAIREAGTHVGEMGALETGTARTATVRALEDLTVAVISEPAFIQVAGRNPDIWRNLARVLVTRLEERSQFIRVPNERPSLFIGSSSEMLEIAHAIQSGLSHDDMAVTVWTDGVFGASENTLASLTEAAERSDFGALVLGPDDVVVSRGSELVAPRDNVIFELGLFMGAVGQQRTLIVLQRGADLRVPTDLLGITPLEFEPGDGDTLAARIGPVCTAIRQRVDELGVK